VSFCLLARIGEEQNLIFDAVANRVPAVSADLAWTSIIVQANGQVVAQALNSDDAGEPALLVGDVQLGPRDAPTSMLGNWVGTFTIAGTIALPVWGAMVIRRRRGRSPV
jgi:hypothetical protein